VTDFRDYYRKELKEISGEALGPEHGMDPAVIDLASAEKGVVIPAALRDYYLVAGHHEINREHNILYLPDQLAMVDGYLVFAEENQRVVIWGFREDELESADPVVYQSQDPETLGWYSEKMAFSIFIVKMWRWQRGLE
jgi:hypothetical protein